MDVSNLQKHHPLLLKYLRDNGYSLSRIQWIRRCVKLVIKEGSSSKIESYEQLYWFEVRRREYEDDAPVRKSLKSALGHVRKFDLEGRYPQRNLYNFFLAATKNYDLLNAEYKSIVDHYRRAAESGTKVSHTIYTESRAGTLFLLHLQNVGAQSITDVTERQVLDFFFDGEKIIRGKAFKDKITPVLKAAITINEKPVKKLLSLLPSIPKSYPNYPYLAREESEKFRICLEEENSQLTLLDKAIATIAYYTGLRGTDIFSMIPENIDWEKETIHFVQSKTGVEQTLPMSAIVGNAIWDYIIYERPESECMNIFVSGTKPYNEISKALVASKKRI